MALRAEADPLAALNIRLGGPGEQRADLEFEAGASWKIDVV